MGKKGTKRKTRWRVLPIGEDGGSGSGNEEESAPGELECDHLGGSAGTYARATQHHQQQRYNNNTANNNTGYRRPNTTRTPGGYYNKQQQQQQYHHPRSYNNHDNNSVPLVTTEKQIFNEEEYTKITTPRQDVLFKKGYLGRKKPTVPVEQDATLPADPLNHVEHNGDMQDIDPNDVMDEHPQFIYTNGFVDQTGVYYINGTGYEMYDPYSGNITVIVGPHYGPNGGPPVLAAVPCQPVPLQPLEWFNPPGFLPYVTGPCQNGLPRDRRKRYSTDSQNCSPQSSESTGPPGSPQESDEVAVTGAEPPGNYNPPMYTHQPPSYVYPGYMFGAPMYNMNGVTVQSTPNQAPSSDVGGKRRKKKRRRRRKRNGVEDGSEESSSEDKGEEEEPTSVTSQESSLESDSKHSVSSLSGDNPNLKPRQSIDALQPQATDIVIEQLIQPVFEPIVDRECQTVLISKPQVDFVVHTAAVFHQVNGVEHSNGVNGTSSIEVSKVTPIENPYQNINGNSVNSIKLNGEAKPVNGYEKPKEKKGKKANGVCNGVAEKPLVDEVVQEPCRDEPVYERYEDFGEVNGFANGNAEDEWITVKAKGSQGRKSETTNGNGKYPVELTNGHAKPYKEYRRDENGSRVNGKDKVYQRNADKFYKNEKNHNGKSVEEKCTYSKVKQVENAKEKQSNGKGRNLNYNKMDGNEKEDGKEKDSRTSPNSAEKERKSSGSSSEGSKQSDIVAKSNETEETPLKPSRKDRKKPSSPPKTPEVVLTATAKPFVMPPMSARVETFIKPSDVTLEPNELSKEDNLLATLTSTSNSQMQDDAKENSKLAVAFTSHESADTIATSQTVQSLKELSSKSIPQDLSNIEDQLVNSSMVKQDNEMLKITSQDFLLKESELEIASISNEDDTKERPASNVSKPDLVVTNDADSDSDRPPIAPPRRKKWRPANKRLSSERAPTPGKLCDSAEESSSSSSQESEESVIECLSSGINSPEVKEVSGFSSEDDEVIYTGKLGVPDLEVTGSLKAAKDREQGNQSAVNDNAALKEPENELETPNEIVLPQVSNESSNIENEQFSNVIEDAERVAEVKKIAKEIVNSVIDDSVKEAVRLKEEKETDKAPSPLGITDAVTRWLRSQSPDVLSVPNDDSMSEDSDAFEADVEETTDTGSKNLLRNPLPVPSVNNNDDDQRLNDEVLIGDGTSRRVAKNHADCRRENVKSVQAERGETTTPDFDDSQSNESIPCGEWDLWDCRDAIAVPDYEEPNGMVAELNDGDVSDPMDHILCHAPTFSVANPHVTSPTPEYINLPGERIKYDPLANDTFSSMECALLEPVESPTHDRCSNMCDPNVSVAKYYLLGPPPEKTSSPVQDVESCDSDDNGIIGDYDKSSEKYQISLAAELARLEQPLPKSWAVAPLQTETGTKPMKKCSCKCNCSEDRFGIPSDSGVESGDESIGPRKREGTSVFKRKLVGRLRGEGMPFPCGGICCIVQ